jgi:hypothetical protein
LAMDSSKTFPTSKPSCKYGVRELDECSFPCTWDYLHVYSSDKLRLPFAPWQGYNGYK